MPAVRDLRRMVSIAGRAAACGRAVVLMAVFLRGERVDGCGCAVASRPAGDAVGSTPPRARVAATSAVSRIVSRGRNGGADTPGGARGAAWARGRPRLRGWGGARGGPGAGGGAVGGAGRGWGRVIHPLPLSGRFRR